MNRGDQPIAILGSGLGGLAVVRVLRKLLPGEAIVYLGDTAQGAYGDQSAEAITRRALLAGAALARHSPKLLVLASDSASACSLAALQAAAPCPVLDIIACGAQAAAAVAGPVGIIGTRATIASGAYEAAILQRNPQAVLHALACPLLVPLAAEGWLADPITDAICRRYLNQIPFEAHTVLLGSTSFPSLLPSLARTRPSTTWLDSGELTALAVERLLASGPGFRTLSAQGPLQVLLTDLTAGFKTLGEQFLGEALTTVEPLALP